MTTSQTQKFEINEVSSTGAGEIVGLDCSQPLDAETVRAVRAAFLRYPILAFRDQPLTVPELVSFTKQFGPIEPQSLRPKYTHPESADVLIISNELRPDGTAIGIIDAGDALHTDMQFDPKPAMATLLQAVRNPSQGGDTEYVNMYQVYDALPEPLKRRVAGLSASNHPSKLRSKRLVVSKARTDAADFYQATEQSVPDQPQPVVRTHPETGRQALYVSPRFSHWIVDVDQQESAEILDQLFAIMAEPRFKYFHTWRDNDLVMWDNRCLAHRATGGYALPDIRRMHRTQVQGDVPFYRA